VKNSLFKKENHQTFFLIFFFGGLKILPTISTCFLVLVFFFKNREFVTEYSLSKILFFGKMAKNHHLGPSQVLLVKELGNYVVALSKRDNGTKECFTLCFFFCDNLHLILGFSYSIP
jgi:hypothetical protein